MKYLVLSVTLLYLVNLALSDVTVQAKENLTTYDIFRELQLTCKIQSDGAKVQVKWEKNGTSVNDIPSLKEKIKTSEKDGNYTLRVEKATDEEAGNYTCVALVDNKEAGKVVMLAVSNARVKTQTNINVVEGEKLRIVCTVYGNPPPEISWVIGNETYTESKGPVKLMADEEKKIPNSILVIENINMTDRGIYKCVGYSEITHETVEDEIMVRIKDKYAALWPFLGICLEVFVLCAIILIYEKKRNKTELEESDTDQSPDQKNTPDHGKESNLRHRQ